MAFERVHFGFEPVFSHVLEAWCLADGRDFHIADDRRGKQRWPTPEEGLKHSQAETEHAQAEAERARAEAERARAEAERERQARFDIERRLAELESKLQR